MLVGRPAAAVDWFDRYLELGRDPLGGPTDEAMDSAAGVVRVAEETGNPYALSYALLAYGPASLDAGPEGALAAMSRGLVARASGIAPPRHTWA
ncbi:hypothetical protein [Mycobacterium sp. URHB0021]|jgi:hypothetical protein